MKEYKVGEQITFQGKVLEVVETKKPTCTGCFFDSKNLDTQKCMPNERSDGNNVMFVEKGK